MWTSFFTKVTHFPFSCALLGLTFVIFFCWIIFWGDFLFHSQNFSCALQYFKFYNLNSVKKMLKTSSILQHFTFYNLNQMRRMMKKSIFFGVIQSNFVLDLQRVLVESRLQNCFWYWDISSGFFFTCALCCKHMLRILLLWVCRDY